MLASAQLAAASVGGIARWVAVHQRSGPSQHGEHLHVLIGFSCGGLAVSLFAIECCPSLAAALAALP